MSYQFKLLFINNQHTISDLQSSSVLIYYSFSVHSSVLVIWLHLESTCYLPLSFHIF